MILEANNDIMKSLGNFYDGLLKNDAFDDHLKRDCREDIRDFVAQIDDMIYEANMQIRRAKLLVKITADRKGLARVTPAQDQKQTNGSIGSSASSRAGHRCHLEVDMDVL